MAGILIYTAAGDAEGTLGGLVRMGKPGRLEPLLSRRLPERSGAPPIPCAWKWAKAAGKVPIP